MVGAGESEMRTEEKDMLLFTYKPLPDNNFDVICRRAGKEGHITMNELLSKMYGRQVHIVLT